MRYAKGAPGDEKPTGARGIAAGPRGRSNRAKRSWILRINLLRKNSLRCITGATPWLTLVLYRRNSHLAANFDITGKLGTYPQLGQVTAESPGRRFPCRGL